VLYFEFMRFLKHDGFTR